MRICFGLAIVLLSFACNSPILDHKAAPPVSTPLQVKDTTGCALEFKKIDLCVSLTWEHKPSGDEKGEFTLHFWKKSEGTEHGPYVTPSLKVAVKLFMPSMGHGSSPVKIAAKTDAGGTAIPGVFSVTEVFFVMEGKWQIQIQLKDGTDVQDQVINDIDV